MLNSQSSIFLVIMLDAKIVVNLAFELTFSLRSCDQHTDKSLDA